MIFFFFNIGLFYTKKTVSSNYFNIYFFLKMINTKYQFRVFGLTMMFFKIFGDY